MRWVNQDRIHSARTCRPLFEQHQATAHPVKLDPAHVLGAPDIYPGMVATQIDGETVGVSDGTAGDKSFGLFTQFIMAAENETEHAYGMTSVWRGGPDATFEVKAPAFDDTKAWANPANGAEILIVPGSGVNNKGKLCPAGVDATVGYEVAADADPVARLVRVIDAETIEVALYI